MEIGGIIDEQEARHRNQNESSFGISRLAQSLESDFEYMELLGVVDWQVRGERYREVEELSPMEHNLVVALVSQNYAVVLDIKRCKADAAQQVVFVR